MKWIATLLVFLLLACTEEVPVTPYEYSKVFSGETSRGWTIRSVLLWTEGKATLPLFLDECDIDDIYVFYADADHTYQVREGGKRCTDGSPAVITQSNWSFVSSKATLTIPIPLIFEEPLPFTVREVDESRMTLEIFFDEGKGSYRFNFRSTSIE